jgi:hypothetical protein
MATTTNFGWETPDDTDLVKDGALAMRTLGNAIDTSLVDLKGGTTGQFLSKASNTDMDFTWTSSGGGMTQLAAANFPTGVATFDITSISGSYNNLQLVLRDFDCASDTNLLMRFNSNTGSNYAQTTITQTGASTATLTANTYSNFYITDGDVDLTAGENQLIITIFDYANSSTYKTATVTGVFKDGGATFWNTYYSTMGWLQTSAITSITIFNSATSNFDAGSYVLYGVK